MAMNRMTHGLAFASAAVTALAWLPLAGFVPDDTYIHLQYARHLRDGDGLVFNLGERVYASTSPLWSALLAALGGLGLDLVRAAAGLSLLCAMLASGVTAVFFARVLPPWAAACAALLFALDVWFVRWAGSGMETSLAVLLVVLGFERYVATEPWGSRPLGPGTWWALAALVRPEAALLPVLLALRVALEPAPRAERLWGIARALGPSVVIGGAWMAYATVSQGSPLPVTIHAKSIESRGLAGAFRNLALMLTVLASSRPLELVAAIARALLLRGAGPTVAGWRAHVVPAGWLLGLPLFFAVSGVPGVTRYLVPITPLLVAYGWRALARVMPTRRGLAACALAAASAGMFTFGVHVVPQARAFARGLDATWIAQGRWFAAHTPPGARVALRDIGAFAYHSNRPIVDLGGLVTPQAVPLLREHTYDEIAVELLFGEFARPQYFIDVALEPGRLIRDSRFGPCLELVQEGRLDHRALRKREKAWVSAYRIHWGCVDSTRRASARPR